MKYIAAGLLSFCLLAGTAQADLWNAYDDDYYYQAQQREKIFQIEQRQWELEQRLRQMEMQRQFDELDRRIFDDSPYQDRWEWRK